MTLREQLRMLLANHRERMKRYDKDPSPGTRDSFELNSLRSFHVAAIVIARADDPEDSSGVTK